jgi:hypothetical protein
MARKRFLRNPVLLFPVLLIFAFLTACHPEPVMPQDPRIYIIDPATESSLEAGAVTIKTFVERFELAEETGHIVYYMDVAPPMVQDESALPAEGAYAESIDTSHTWTNVPPGEHTFWVQLVNSDGTPLQPPQAVRVYVTVR